MQCSDRSRYLTAELLVIRMCQLSAVMPTISGFYNKFVNIIYSPNVFHYPLNEIHFPHPLNVFSLVHLIPFPTICLFILNVYSVFILMCVGVCVYIVQFLSNNIRYEARKFSCPKTFKPDSIGSFLFRSYINPSKSCLSYS